MNLQLRPVARRAFRTARAVSNLARNLGPGPDGPYKLFVVGSGRSGTHWLGYLLKAFPSTHVTVEKPPIFPWVVAMAQDAERESSLFPRLARAYRWEHAGVLPRHYVDKSHPNLWIAGRLAAEFPEARFVAIWRRLEGTVASMLKHDGVRHWAEAWDADPRPSRFLGINEDFVATYRAMSIPARCAVRAVAHAREITRIAPELGRRMLIFEYGNLHHHAGYETRRLADLIDAPVPESVPEPESRSLDKWREQLGDADLRDIRATAAFLGAEDLLERVPTPDRPFRRPASIPQAACARIHRSCDRM